ncbi:MAG: hypothetical protein WD492_06480 [Alkalispirochaeta sp.]
MKHRRIKLWTVLVVLGVVAGLLLIGCDTLLGEDGDLDEDNTGNPAPTTDEFESNDERADAVPIDLDTKYNVEIGEKTDDDWFKITPAHGSDTYDKVQISVTDVSASLYIHIEIYKADGESVATHGTTTGGQDLTYTFATPGAEYYVRFSGWSGYASDHNSTGSYSFTVSNLYANDNFAPNHTLETAEDSLEYGNDYDGVIVSKYENDYYSFSNPTPGAWNSYTFTLTDVSDGLYGRFHRYGADGSELERIGTDTAGADLTYTFNSKENDFYIRVSGWSGYASENNSSGSYTLTPVSNGNDDNEPDDTFDDAREITSYPTGDLTGTVLTTAANNNGGDYEFFEVILKGDKKVAWTVDPEASNTELHFNVYDADRSFLGDVDGDDAETIGSFVNNLGSTDTFFYIKLGAYVGDNGNYTISFTETDADPN